MPEKLEASKLPGSRLPTLEAVPWTSIFWFHPFTGPKDGRTATDAPSPSPYSRGQEAAERDQARGPESRAPERCGL